MQTLLGKTLSDESTNKILVIFYNYISKYFNIKLSVDILKEIWNVTKILIYFKSKLFYQNNQFESVEKETFYKMLLHILCELLKSEDIDSLFIEDIIKSLLEFNKCKKFFSNILARDFVNELILTVLNILVEKSRDSNYDELISLLYQLMVSSIETFRMILANYINQLNLSDKMKNEIVVNVPSDDDEYNFKHNMKALVNDLSLLNKHS